MNNKIVGQVDKFRTSSLAELTQEMEMRNRARNKSNLKAQAIQNPQERKAALKEIEDEDILLAELSITIKELRKKAMEERAGD